MSYWKKLYKTILNKDKGGNMNLIFKNFKNSLLSSEIKMFCFSKWQSSIKSTKLKIREIIDLSGDYLGVFCANTLSLSKKINGKFLVQSTKCDHKCMLKKKKMEGGRKIKHCQNPTSSFSLFLQTPQVQPIRHASITHRELNDKHLI